MGVYDIILIFLAGAENAWKTQGEAYGFLKVRDAFSQQGRPGGPGAGRDRRSQ